MLQSQTEIFARRYAGFRIKIVYLFLELRHENTEKAITICLY